MIALNTVRPGANVRIRRLDASPEVSTRLREMGFCENATVRCLQSGAACVCLVQHCRVALGAQLAQLILVEPALDRLPVFAEAGL